MSSLRATHALGRNEDALRQPLSMHFPLCTAGLDIKDDDDDRDGAADEDGRALDHEDGVHLEGPAARRRGDERHNRLLSKDHVRARLVLWLADERAVHAATTDVLASYATRWGQGVVADVYVRHPFEMLQLLPMLDNERSRQRPAALCNVTLGMVWPGLQASLPPRDRVLVRPPARPTWTSLARLHAVASAGHRGPAIALMWPPSGTHPALASAAELGRWRDCAAAAVWSTFQAHKRAARSTFPWAVILVDTDADADADREANADLDADVDPDADADVGTATSLTAISWQAAPAFVRDVSAVFSARDAVAATVRFTVVMLLPSSADSTSAVNARASSQGERAQPHVPAGDTAGDAPVADHAWTLAVSAAGNSSATQAAAALLLAAPALRLVASLLPAVDPASAPDFGEVAAPAERLQFASLWKCR